MAELNIRKKLEQRKGKRPNSFMYQALRVFAAQPQCKAMNLEIIDKVGVENIKGQFLMFSNHTSRCDWQYIGLAMKKHRMNFMASDVEFHRAHMHWIFDVLHVIPKKNFVTDYHSIKETLQVFQKGGSVILFPEGKSSISGTNQPVMPGTGALMKRLNVPVYYARITGGYMANTQWNIQDRPGKVIITIDKLCTAEETQYLTTDELERRTNAAIYNDDFEWNKTARVAYAGNENVANKLEEHLYFCPKCGAEMMNHGEGNTFRCTSCGNGMTINAYYDLIPLNKDCVIPKNLRVWYELQRRKEYRAIKNNPNFCLEEKVTLGIQPTDHYVDKHITSEPVGEGILKLTRDEFSYVGTKKGEHFEIHQPTKNLLSVVFETDSSNFGAFFGGEYYEFKPARPSCTKWQISVEECHRIAGGVWQNTIPQQQWIYEEDKPTDKENYYL